MRKKLLAAIAVASVALVLALAALIYLTVTRGNALPNQTPDTVQTEPKPVDTTAAPETDATDLPAGDDTQPSRETTMPEETVPATESTIPQETGPQVEITFPQEQDTEPAQTTPPTTVPETPHETTKPQEYETPEVGI